VTENIVSALNVDSFHSDLQSSHLVTNSVVSAHIVIIINAIPAVFGRGRRVPKSHSVTYLISCCCYQFSKNP